MPSTYIANCKDNHFRWFDALPNNMKHICLLVLLILCAITPSIGHTLDDIPNVHVADRTRFLSNPDAIISPRYQTAVDSILSDIWKTTSAEAIVVVIDSITAPTDPETFATDLFEKWGVGKSDNSNGLMLFVSVKDRTAVIRTGYGMEGTVPDIVAGSIIRHDLLPRFKEGDYDRGVLNAVRSLHTVVSDPAAADELKSKYLNDQDAFADDDAWHFYLNTGLVCLAVALILIFFHYSKNRKDPQKLWDILSPYKLPLIVVTIFFIGIPLPALLVLLLILRRIRKGSFRCVQCHGKMHKVDTAYDWRFLNPSQLTERRLNSVEHEVWECEDCGSTEVKSYRNPSTVYTVCPLCSTRAMHLTSDRTVVAPTTLSGGIGERTYNCEHCNHVDRRQYRIARKTPVVIVPGGGGGFGGISGGSFGGGHTGGGGASGHW